MNQQITGSRSVLILRKYESDFYARQAFIKFMSVYESTANKQVIAQKCHNKLSTMHWTHTYQGGASKFLADFQQVMEDYNYASGTAMDNNLKRTMLFNSVQDREFFSTRDMLLLDPTADFTIVSANLNKRQ